MAEIFGKQDGYCKGKGGSMHLADFSIGILGESGIVASSVPVATGAALTSKLQKKDFVSLVFFGDGASNQGAWHESMNLAALWKLPVIFVCENNQFSCFTHLSERQPQNRKIFEMVSGLGIDSSECDGNDVIAVQERTAQLVNKIKKGEGPKFLELHTYRWLEHCGPNYDDELGYRTINDIKKSRENDPIIILEKKYPE